MVEQRLHVGSYVFIHGLTSPAGRAMNLKAGRVVKVPEDSDRLGVQLLPQCTNAAPKLLKRMNLLIAASPSDRELLLGLQTLRCARELRIARPALDAVLREDYGLLLQICAYVARPRSCLFQFGGFMGKVWEEHWAYVEPARPLALKPRPAPRLDAATTDMGLGRVLFAGGCGQHPRLCRPPEGFFKTAEIYDSLTDDWSPIADMPTRRHGASACLLNDRVYVLGGMYVDERRQPPSEKFCDVLDTRSLEWSSLPPTAYANLSVHSSIWERTAFFGCGAVGSRLVALLGGLTLVAYNPERSADGWHEVEGEGEVRVGHSSCACTYEGELVVASGRPEPFARAVAAFKFTAEASDPRWWRGSWRQLPDLNSARVGASLTVVHGRLYITGGVDETTQEFLGNAERLSPDGWAPVPWFSMPRPLHAHDSFALPYLER